MATVAGTPTAAPVAAPPKSHGLTERAKAERKLGLLLVMPSVVVMILVAGFPILYAIWLVAPSSRPAVPEPDRVDRSR